MTTSPVWEPWHAPCTPSPTPIAKQPTPRPSSPSCAWLTERFDAETAENVTVLYGGSCKPGNAAELFAQPDIDGGLIGGASLKAEDFTAIIAARTNA